MKRDLDLIRALLVEFEGLPLDGAVSAREVAVEPWSSDQIIYHCFLMQQSALIDARDASTMGGKNILVLSLTSAGHDYLDAVRSDTIWNKVKSQAAAQGLSFTLDMAKTMAVFYGKQILGLP